MLGLKRFPMRGTRTELSTAGLDPSLQNVSSDPHGGAYNVGLRIPPAPPAVSKPQNRFLYILSMMRVNANAKVRVVGMRQLVTIGQFVENDAGQRYPVEIEVESPFWHFSDANITWYIQRVPPLNINTAGFDEASTTSTDSEGAQFAYSVTPALLYQEIATAYVPPNGGAPYGVPLTPDLSGFHDLRFNWRSNNAWNNSLDIQVEGPCDIALFASVQQTNPETRPVLGVTDAQIPYISKEDAFTVNFPEAVYWRIAGSLIFEETQYIEEPRGLQEDYHALDLPRPIRGEPGDDR